jgi:MoaA/NifB/PqqE/SkfB family radical SAM enzyme
MNFWPWFFRFPHHFHWLQVEVTTYCQAACLYCPHTVYRDRWESRHLDLAIFKRLLPELHRVHLVYLQGWGEPFLHPDFFTLVSLAKRAGCQVGTTTNGMLLDVDLLSRLVDQEVNVVAFSLAGVGESNDAVRRGTRFALVLEALRQLQDLKMRKGAVLPKVHVAYMLLRSGLVDLPRLPSALAGLGVSQVVVSTLDFVAAPELARESLRLGPPEEYRDLLARLADLAAQGRRLGLEVFHHLPPLGRGRPQCPENIHRSLCVAADGQVAPCVYLNLKVPGGTMMTSLGERRHFRLTFGSLAEKTLPQIWRTPGYRRWRQEVLYGNLPFSCQGCLKLGSAREIL